MSRARSPVLLHRPADALRLQRGAEHLHRLGARATAEFLCGCAVVHGCDADLLDRLDDWRERLSPVLVREVGADRFPPMLCEVAE